MSAWKLEAGRCITTPDGTFYLAYGRTTDGSNAPLFRGPAELDRIARQVAVLPELLAALEDALEMRGEHGQPLIFPGSDWAESVRALLAKVQP